MNVDWNWIKQRPHFIAEKLNESYEIMIIYQYRYGRKDYQKRNTEGLNIKPLYVIPKGDRYTVTKKINNFLMKVQIKKVKRNFRPDYIYATFPTQIEYIGRTSISIIYDCMDNHPSFVVDKRKKEELIKLESKLVNKAKIILCSSQQLQFVLTERYGIEIKRKIEIIRNGYNGEILDLKESSIFVDNKYKIAYFGTISSWFNFDFLTRSLKDIPKIEYVLIGPITGVEIPESNRIKYIGTIEHDKLYDAVKDVDCLFMPFVVNEIIKSVDPVKLYEYINMNKDILCVKYPEVKHFEPFVNFYNTYDEYVFQIKMLMQTHDRKYTNAQRLEFLRKNDWNNRAARIKKIIDDEES